MMDKIGPSKTDPKTCRATMSSKLSKPFIYEGRVQAPSGVPSEGFSEELLLNFEKKGGVSFFLVSWRNILSPPLLRIFVSIQIYTIFNYILQFETTISGSLKKHLSDVKK